MPKHKWGYTEKNGSFVIGCVDCGAVGKVVYTEEEAKQAVYGQIKAQSGSNSVFNKYPKTSMGRRQKEAKRVRNLALSVSRAITASKETK